VATGFELQAEFMGYPLLVFSLLSGLCALAIVLVWRVPGGLRKAGTAATGAVVLVVVASVLVADYRRGEGMVFSDEYVAWLPAGSNPHELVLRERYTRQTGRGAMIPSDWIRTFTPEYLRWIPPGANPHDLALRERYSRDTSRPATTQPDPRAASTSLVSRFFRSLADIAKLANSPRPAPRDSERS
jgi:hypothetical protein